MQFDKSNQLNASESLLLSEINNVFKWNWPECDVLEFTYSTIKLQGGAFKMDVMQLASLGIPLFTILAVERGQSVSHLVHHLDSGSISYYEIHQALKSFLTFYQF